MRSEEPPPLKLSTPRPDDLPSPPGQAPGRSEPGAGASRPDPGASGPGPGASRPGPDPSGPGLGASVRAGLRQVLRAVRRIPLRVRLIVAGAMVAMLLAGCGAYTLIERIAYAPEEPVDELVAAFNDGDLGRAARLAGCTGSLCQADALRQGYQPPTDLRIAGVSRGDPTAVQLSYRLAGEPRESTIEVRRGGPFENWSIASGATGYLDVLSPMSRTAQVAGATVTALRAPRTGGGRTGAHEALLGAYTVTAAAEDPLFTAAPATVVVTGGSRAGAPARFELDLTVKPTAVEEVNRQIRARLDECARSTDFAPRHSVGSDSRKCPFGYQKVIYKPADVSWRVDEYPQVELRRSDRPTVDGAPLTLRTTTPGRATVTYTSGGVPQSATVEVEMRGLVYVDEAGKVAWAG